MNNFTFSSMVATIGNLNSPTVKTISKEDYEIFQKEFIFDSLTGKSFGEAFCEKFSINDFMLTQLSNKTAKYHIESLGYIK